MPNRGNASGLWAVMVVAALMGVWIVTQFIHLESRMSPLPAAQAAQEDRVDLWAFDRPEQVCRSMGGTGWLLTSSKEDTWAPTLKVWCLQEGSPYDSTRRLVSYTQAVGADSTMGYELVDGLSEDSNDLKPILAPFCGDGTYIGWGPTPRFPDQPEGAVVKTVGGTSGTQVVGANGGTLYCLDATHHLAELHQVGTSDQWEVPPAPGRSQHF